MRTDYESIYRLVLITHESRCPVDGAIAGKRRLLALGVLPLPRKRPVSSLVPSTCPQIVS